MALEQILLIGLIIWVEWIGLTLTLLWLLMKIDDKKGNNEN